MNETDQQLLVKALEAATNAILITDRTGRIVWVNSALCHQSGYMRHELIGDTPHLLHSGHQDRTFYQDLWQTILAGQAWQGQLIERHKDGGCYTVNQVITPLFDDTGCITHFVAIQHSLTMVDQERAQMHQLAYHDGLTGLANRMLFLELVRQAINHAAQQGLMLGLMFLDLDQFKRVNDRFSHAIGDQLLVAVAERLGRSVRKTDVVARLSGDEFAILVTNLDRAEILQSMASLLIASIEQPFMLDEHLVESRISIGISLYPRDGETAEVLLNRADAAMYKAKASGGGTYCFSTEE